MRDLSNNLSTVATILPVAHASTVTGSAVDLAGFGSAMAIVATGAVTSAGDFTTKLQESDTTTSGDFTDIAAANLIGSLPATLAADTVYELGFRISKRYVRAVSTKNGGTNVVHGVVIVRGLPMVAPV